MIRNLFRREDGRRRAIEALHIRINAAARVPALYLALGVPDTVEGRFETLCLTVILVLRRLRQLPAPAEDVAQDLVDSVFAQLDSSLRELGVGDLGVAKRMKKLAQAFYGRARAYDAALDAGDAAALAAALARNVLGRDAPEAAAPLAAYVVAADAALGQHDLDRLMAEGPVLPDPAPFGPAA
ncbi:ubiquinol-cytochrome c chaperone [Methylobacterium sp. 4-46]|uniref:ubiquinol-cytochrome C chaperone family protein n=1 Tax=unclassified Methylobacterium TaxID=2615210 RepID=UPI000152E7D1|nr:MULTISPECIES: ubiquinol-cytochrome C chaperone family protein [Methylobacterium]ACA20494.1 ubiquinol-cytochrome c chaperone [Methylobacterium sp. 4-46]WFT79660.1 ubiquinol-cytochrome C chaperone family protein [Methylobacterium nodulans]